MDIAIIGGGIAGLTLALDLHQRGLSCRVYEGAPELKELGVGITLLPHAMREFAALGLDGELAAQGIENEESRFYNRFGQLLYAEKRGRFAGYPIPEIGIHRAKLHMTLYRAAQERLGPGRIFLGHQCIGTSESEGKVTIGFRDRPHAVADVVIACDGVNSAVRRQFYPDEKLVFTGINTWRGVTTAKPFLGGRTYVRAGSINTGKIVIYPIVDNVDGKGNQLINWTTEIKTDTTEQNDWNKPGKLEDFYPIYESWKFDWLDVAKLIRDSDVIFEYPMVDKDPIARWTFGRVTLMGDAAHPMYPRGSNGAAQAVIDARTLADILAKGGDAPAALREYEAARVEPTARVVRTNRQHPPDFIIIRVEELVGDRPFDDLDKYITQGELKELSDRYKRVAGFAAEDIAAG
jgi:2-polyprenyl-6-methoxyphenol hydroxylase-like FAD-dependent oxidoreductase